MHRLPVHGPACILTTQFWCHFALVATLRLLYCFYDATTSFIFSADSLCFLFARQSLLAAEFWKLVIFTSTSVLCTVTNLPWHGYHGRWCWKIMWSPVIFNVWLSPHLEWNHGHYIQLNGKAGHALPYSYCIVATFSFHCNYFTKILLRCCCCVLKLSNCLSWS